MSNWNIQLTGRFIKELARLDKPIRRQVSAFLDGLTQLEDPRQRGKAVVGELRDYWRYRVGDYRVIVVIDDKEVRVIAITVGHRSRVYNGPPPNAR